MQGNKGEWSEFYAFLKILSEKKVNSADSQLNAIFDKSLDVITVGRDGQSAERNSYDLKDPSEVKIFNSNKELIRSIPYSSFKNSIGQIFTAMKNAATTTFRIPIAESVAESLLCTNLGAASSSKSDLFLVIHDRFSPQDVELGFSVKSMLGAPSTLLNPSMATNFVYKIADGKAFNSADINAMGGASKVRDRVQSIIDHSGNMLFSKIENRIFDSNLRIVDTLLPEILAELLRNFYAGKGRTVSELVEVSDFSKINSGGFELTKDHCSYKIKQFLSAVALGMVPSKRWNGLTSAQGGYIVVREDGELVCYHLYNRDEFQNYLFSNTKFETPSTGRYEFATIYEEDGVKLIKLNLQIRFLR